MDSQGYNNDDKWVEERIAKLSPPSGWRPDTDKAFESLMQRTSPKPSSRGLRLSMAGATIAVIAVIVALLPWKALWTPESSLEVPQTYTGPVPFTGVVQIPDAASQTQKTEAPAAPATQTTEGPAAPATQTTPPPQVNPPNAPQDGKQETIRRPKKEPRIIAGTIEEPRKEPVPSIAQAQAPQNPQNPPSGVTLPVVIYQVQPEYTDEARQARITGVVELLAIVRVDGSVKMEQVTKSLGYGLDESAVAAVVKWKFIPGKKDGQPVDMSTKIRVQFGLK